MEDKNECNFEFFDSCVCHFIRRFWSNIIWPKKQVGKCEWLRGGENSFCGVNNMDVFCVFLTFPIYIGWDKMGTAMIADRAGLLRESSAFLQ
ncbi:MAG: hypothetical protein AAB736_01500 [Patescibacteria group bacterium]